MHYGEVLLNNEIHPNSYYKVEVFFTFKTSCINNCNFSCGVSISKCPKLGNIERR